MSFLQPLLLLGLPLVLAPVIIHLIHQWRRRQVQWAAMMFLLAAQRMHKGLSKLRQYLILALRMLAVAAIIFVIGRPLAGGLLGLTGGAPESVIVLLDRSASMNQKLLSTGTSKREAALGNLTAAIREAYGTRSKLTLIDSATLEATPIEKPEVLRDLPQTGPTDTAADVPALLQAALDYIAANQTGRTDIWLVSDLQQSDWNAGGGRWKALREALGSLEGVRVHVLAYPESAESDLGIVVEKTVRRKTADGAELLLDFRVRRSEPVSEPATVPVRVVVNGAGSTLDVVLQGDEALMQAKAIPIDESTERGWGRVELPADTNPANDAYHFVFGEPPPLNSVIVSEEEGATAALRAALAAPADPGLSYGVAVLPPGRVAEIRWEETSLVVWQAALPPEDSEAGKFLKEHLRSGRCVVFLPPESPGDEAFDGVRWTGWRTPEGGSVQPEWWRSDAGLLAKTRSGTALPVGEIEVQRWCGIEGEGIPLARLGEQGERAPLLLRSSREGQAGAYFLAGLPGPGDSSLGRDGVVLYALLHRALQEGARSLGNALQRTAAPESLGADPSAWKRVDLDENVLVPSGDRPLQAGVLERPAAASDEPALLVALNRAPDEDAPQNVARSTLDEMFSGLDWRLHERTLEDEKSLTNEVWRTFLLAMAAALVFEALLCMPGRRRQESASPVEQWREAA